MRIKPASLADRTGEVDFATSRSSTVGASESSSYAQASKKQLRGFHE
jgi:hypothetical protein